MERIHGIKQYKEQKFDKNNNSLIIHLLGEKPIAFNPALGRLAESATAGLFMSQLLYWDEKGSDPQKTYKTIDNMESETCLTRSEQDRAIKTWKKLKVLDVELRGLPRRRHFHINKDILINLLGLSIHKAVSASKLAESCKQDSQIMQTIYTENTTEKINNRDLQKNNPENSENIKIIMEQCGRAAGKKKQI
jgi:hypothetical protein